MIRPATTRDAEPIARIWNRVITETTHTFTTTEKTEKDVAVMIDTRVVLVWESKGFVEGFGSFGPFRTGSGYAHVAEHTIILAPSVHGQGVGQQMMNALETQARLRGIEILVAGISGSNSSAIEFHTAVGFAKTGHLPGLGRKFDQSLDLVFMQKNI